MRKIYRNIDRAIDSFIEKKVAGSNSLSATDYFDRRGIADRDRLPQILANLREVYDNTASLLTHISAMIAVLGIMLVISGEESWFHLFIQIEIVFYAALAVLCVYNLRRYELNREISRKYLEDIYDSYTKRRYLYVIYTDAVLLVTLVFVLMVFAHFFISIFIG